MITSNREQKICDKYSKRDEEGRVHCNQCPLQKGDSRFWDFRCKANSHYNPKSKEWEYDDYICEVLIRVKEGE